MLNVCKTHRLALIPKFLPSQFSILYSTQSPESIKKNSGAKLVKIPRRKKWGKTAVLRALCDATPPDPRAYTQYPFHCPSNPIFSAFHKRNINQSLKSGKLPVELLKSSNPEFFNLDWIRSPEFENQLNEYNEEMPCDPEFQESTQVLEELIKDKKIVEVCITCIKFLKSGVKISEPMMDKCIAFITHSKSKIKYKLSVDMFEMLDIISKHATLSQSAVSMILRIVPMHSNPGLSKMYKNMLAKGNLPDVDTINYILNLERNTVKSEIFAMETFKHMKRHGISPTIETFCGYLCCVHTFGNRISETQLAEVFASCLNEIEATGIECTLEFYLKMLSLSSRFQKMNLSHGILYHMAKNNLYTPDDSLKRCMSLLHSIMLELFVSQDLETAKKLMATIFQDNYSKVLLGSNEPYFFTHYLRLVLRYDSLVNALETMRKLIPDCTSHIRPLIQELLASAIRHKSPEFLVYIYAEISNSVMDYDSSFSWLRAAVQISKMADMDTLKQFKNICLLMIKNSKREWKMESGFLSGIAFLLAKSEDVIALMDVLAEFKAKYPSKEIDDLAWRECNSAIQKTNDSSLMRKFEQLYPPETSI